MLNNIKGFTFIETILVVGIILVIASVAVPFYGDFLREQQHDIAIREIISNMRRYQMKAISGESSTSFGIHLTPYPANPSNYTLFEGVAYNPADPNNLLINLPTSLELYDVNIGGGNDIVFAKPTGKPSVNGDFKIRVQGVTTEYFQININSEGVIWKN